MGKSTPISKSYKILPKKTSVTRSASKRAKTSPLQLASSSNTRNPQHNRTMPAIPTTVTMDATTLTMLEAVAQHRFAKETRSLKTSATRVFKHFSTVRKAMENYPHRAHNICFLLSTLKAIATMMMITS